MLNNSKTATMEKSNSLQPIQESTSPVIFNFFDPVQFETMQRVCKLFSNSELVPDMYRATDKSNEAKAMANCMIAIEMAQRIGASPLMIMQNMNIIYGRPSWASKFLIATVNTCGRFNPLQFRFTNLGKVGKMTITEYEKKWVAGANGSKGYYKSEPKQVEFNGIEIDNLQCVAYTTAKGSTDILESSPVDIKLAVNERWFTKDGSKWPTMPRQMLMYRAASFWTNAYAPELSMGMKTTEELQDILDVEYEDVSEKVEHEKADNANKTTISMEQNEPEKHPEQEKVEKNSNVQQNSETKEDKKQPNDLFNGTKQNDSTPKCPSF